MLRSRYLEVSLATRTWLTEDEGRWCQFCGSVGCTAGARPASRNPSSDAGVRFRLFSQLLQFLCCYFGTCVYGNSQKRWGFQGVSGGCKLFYTLSFILRPFETPGWVPQCLTVVKTKSLMLKYFAVLSLRSWFSLHVIFPELFPTALILAVILLCVQFGGIL